MAGNENSTRAMQEYIRQALSRAARGRGMADAPRVAAHLSRLLGRDGEAAPKVKTRKRPK